MTQLRNLWFDVAAFQIRWQSLLKLRIILAENIFEKCETCILLFLKNTWLDGIEKFQKKERTYYSKNKIKLTFKIDNRVRTKSEKWKFNFETYLKLSLKGKLIRLELRIIITTRAPARTAHFVISVVAWHC